MSTSTIILYKDTNLRPSKNFIIDYLGTYLAQFEYDTIQEFQYIKHGLNIVIKIDSSQVNLDYLNSSIEQIDYVRIMNSDDSNNYYCYFVMDKKWRSKETILLSLSMDTLNTFRYHYSLTDKTVVHRQHKDRFVQDYSYGGNMVSIPSSIYVDSSVYEYLPLVLDKNSWVSDQNVYCPNGITVRTWRYHSDRAAYILADTYTGDRITCDGSTFTLLEDATTILSITSSTYSQYAYYITCEFSGFEGNPGNYLDLFSYIMIGRARRVIDLQTEGITPVLYGTNKGEVEGDEQSWYLVYMGNPLRCYITADNPFSTSITQDGIYAPSDLVTGRYYYLLPEDSSIALTLSDGTNTRNISLYKETNEIMYGLCFWTDGTKIYYYTINWAWNWLTGTWGFPSRATQSSATSLQIHYFNVSDQVDYYYNASEITSLNYTTITESSTAYFTLGKSTIYNAAIGDLDRWEATLYKIIKLPYKPVSTFTGFDYDSTNKMLYLTLPNTKFTNTITSGYNPINELLILPEPLTFLRNKYFESKLYHSDYYLPKFVYDSFSFEFNLELFDSDLINEYSKTDSLSINFNVTTTINSRFMFTFTQWSTDGLSLQDYDNILIVARNNELGIYNSTYLDYVKNGYNYDVKTRERQVSSNWLGFGIGAITSAVSFATGNPVGLAAGVSLAGSTLGQLVGSINNTIQSEQNLQQKLVQLQNQKVSVAGADDVDLMSTYTNNKAKFMLYQVSDRMNEQLNDLFFYTGYADGRMMIPDTTSRTRFNFVSCDPVFNAPKIPEEYLSDMEIRWKAGVTFIHKFNNTWDVNQRYENWEVSLYHYE